MRAKRWTWAKDIGNLWRTPGDASIQDSLDQARHTKRFDTRCAGGRDRRLQWRGRNDHKTRNELTGAREEVKVMGSSVHQTENLLFSILVQLILMIGAARLMSTLFRRLGQPGVVGEIIAGLMLGPSLFGYFFPDLSGRIFGASAATPITIISQIGLVLLMFQIGCAIEFSHLKSKRNSRGVILVTALSIGVPLALGILLGYVSAPVLAPNIDARTYSLFFGVGLAITAVPVLGRIFRQYDLTKTEVGVVAISAAAVNDVIGWLLLAGVSAYASSIFSGMHLALQVGGLALFVAILSFVLRPLVDWLLAKLPLREGEVTSGLMTIVIVLVFLLGISTFKLGIFAIFGGFAAGLLFHHRGDFVSAWQRQVGRFVVVFFLPVFFTYTGLRTNVLGLATWDDFNWLGITLAAAILGKIVPVYIAGRLSGFNNVESCILGSAMNTRGLMELIVLNVGYDLGFIPQKVFTMLVIMAVVTTIMTGPLLKLLLPRVGHVIPRNIEA